ncbi:MAG: hypothetical protein MPI93_02230 [Nitrosopumilus sp.]|nr:hypothetical protein [Nitrosopumilus sp.]
MALDANLQSRVDAARLEFEGRNVVAFIGGVGSGKTVATALLKYTLTEYWNPKKTGVYSIVLRGGDVLNESLRALKNKEPLAPTSEGATPDTVIKLKSSKGLPATYELVIRDMSGENWDLVSGNTDATHPEILARMLEKDLPHFIFATKYVLVVDCSKKGSWDVDGGSAASAIANIAEIRQLVGVKEVTGDMIAVLFTKADLLPPKEKDLTAKDLLGQYKELSNNIAAYAKKATPLKSYVDLRKRGSRKAPKGVGLSIKWDAQNSATLADVIVSAEIEARAAGRSEQEIAQIKAGLLSVASRKGSDKNIGQDVTALRVTNTRIRTPLVYSHGEYTDLISWMIRNGNGLS